MRQRRWGMSQPRACRAIRQPRSTQRYQPADAPRTRRCGRGCAGSPGDGHAGATARARRRREGRLAVQPQERRLWREEGLRVQVKRRKRQRLGDSTVPADRRVAEHIDHVWSIDYQFGVTANGRIVKLCNIVDEHTREALAIHVDRSINADTTVAILDRIVADRGRHPVLLRCDNGPELTAHALRDWRRLGGAGTVYIDPDAPWQNPFIESFNSRLRDECLAAEQFDTPARGPSRHRGLENRPQLQPAALSAGHARPRRLRSQTGPTRTLIAPGPTTGARPQRLSRPCRNPGGHLLG
jgi:putative transposase